MKNAYLPLRARTLSPHFLAPFTHQVRWFAFFVLLVIPTSLSAQALTDTLLIRFPLDSIAINMNFDGNRERWQRFESNFYSRFAHLPPGSLRLDVYSGASPEGTAAHNRWLGENRGQAIRRLVRRTFGNSIGAVVVHNEAARWDGFYDLVADSDEPWRDEVLRIIDLPASTDEDHLDHRELLLRRLQGGKVWPRLLDEYLAPLRSGASAILSWQGGIVVGGTGGGGRDTIVVRDTVYIVSQGGHGGGHPLTGGILVQPSVDDSVKIAKEARRDSLSRERLQYPAWAVKTNLLLWGVVAPIIEVEIPLGRGNRWSLEAEYFVPWFIWSNNAHASQCHNLGLELRHYLGNRTRHRWLHGWHIGMAAAVGYYDIEWKKHDGYQGEYVNAYLNLGYQCRWGRHWALDAAIGIGGMVTKYRHYYGGSVYPQNHLEPWDEHLIWHHSGHYFWPGPCHAALSLAYMFNAWPFATKARKLREYR